jgi:hypothetical protein
VCVELLCIGVILRKDGLGQRATGTISTFAKGLTGANELLLCVVILPHIGAQIFEVLGATVDGEDGILGYELDLVWQSVEAP